MPAHTENGRLGDGPRPLDSPVERIRVRADRYFVRAVPVEVRLAEQGTCQQQRSVDRRELDLLEPVTGFHVEEVIEKSLVAGDVGRLRSLRRIVEKPQRVQSTLGR